MKKLVGKSLLCGIVLFVVSTIVCQAQGPIPKILIGGELTCPTCGVTGEGWVYDGAITNHLGAAADYAASQGYPDVSYMDLVTCPNCGSTRTAGSVLGVTLPPFTTVTVAPISQEGLMNQVQVQMDLHSPYPYAAQQYMQQVPYYQQQTMFNSSGYSYGQFYLDNYVADYTR